jgi:uncharacterized protein (DUF1800 family)
MTFERDAIRPHVLGCFSDLLTATAKHPAMLLYLDNARSTAASSAMTTKDFRLERYRRLRGEQGLAARRRIDRALLKRKQRQEEAQNRLPNEMKNRRGINENYARELMELHTLGVDGGYSQQDVVEVARAFTGWAFYPLGPVAEKARNRLEARMDGARHAGAVRDGDFLFRPDVHDAEEKIILGEYFPEGGGVEEGERVLAMLAHHLSTAKHIARKFATRFVSDTLPDRLVKNLSSVYLETRGDLAVLVRATVASPEFWGEAARRSKIKSPLELATSAVRSIDGEVLETRTLVRWIRAMGQPVYACQAPTGFPDRGEVWTSAGALLQRMKFAVSLALGRVKGVEVHPYALVSESVSELPRNVFRSYGSVVLPERDLDGAIQTLSSLYHDWHRRVKTKRGKAEMVGVLIGSPEFQRH